MNIIGTILLILAGVLLIFCLFKLFKAPIKLLLKLIINTVLAFIFLFVFNFLGAFIGVTLGLNLVNALIIGVLGMPGLGLLLILNWIFLI